jgi:murein DD-endopeptidase MepM/ murein hydrolase activator NlpD
MRGGIQLGRWPRILTALVVAALGTVAAVHLFVTGTVAEPANVLVSDESAAGRPYAQFVEVPEVIKRAPQPVAIALTLDRSASMTSYLEDAGLGRQEAQRWGLFFERSADTRFLLRGHSLTLYKDPETDDLRGFRYNLDERIAINERSFGDGVIRSYQEPIKYVVRPVAVAFRVENDFWHDAARKDLPKPIVATLEYAFEDRHSLKNLPPGSAVRLIYQEKVSRDGTAKLVTGLEAAQIEVNGRTLDAFAFRDENGQARLYDSNGESLGPEALRFPLHFQYISSGFSESRYHPILHEYRPHVGVDLAAHYGTPVKAVADGTVEAAGWCGELGRCVRLQHENGIVSIYGHLSQISGGLEPGTRVRVGQVIGRVGTSGLSTGPHLHFAIEKDGRYVNPLTQSLGVHHHVSARMRGLFDRLKENYLTALSRLPNFRQRFQAPLDDSVAAEQAVSGHTAHRKARRVNTRFSEPLSPKTGPSVQTRPGGGIYRGGITHD